MTGVLYFPIPIFNSYKLIFSSWSNVGNKKDWKQQTPGLCTQKYFSLGLSLLFEAPAKISIIPYHILGWLTNFRC
jgi:hypothetical protein